MVGLTGDIDRSDTVKNYCPLPFAHVVEDTLDGWWNNHAGADRSGDRRSLRVLALQGSRAGPPESGGLGRFWLPDERHRHGGLSRDRRADREALADSPDNTSALRDSGRGASLWAPLLSARMLEVDVAFHGTFEFGRRCALGVCDLTT